MRSYLAVLGAVPISIFYAFLAMTRLIFARNAYGRRAGATFAMRNWGKALLALFGVRLKVQGLEHVHRDRPVIYMANHASMLDIMALVVALPVDLRFIFKKSLLFIPFVGQAMYLMGMIPIDRQAGARAAESLKKAGEQVRDGKHILIFPEGTRTRTGKLMPFKKGGFYLAIQESIPIVPVSINNSQALCGRNSVLARSGEMEVIAHAPINTDDYNLDNRRELIDKVRETIQSDLRGTYICEQL